MTKIFWTIKSGRQCQTTGFFISVSMNRPSEESNKCNTAANAGHLKWSRKIQLIILIF